MKSNMWDQLLEPVNPHLCVLLSFLNILYGAWLFIQASDPSIVFPYLDYLLTGQVWGAVLIGIGLFMYGLHRYAKTHLLSRPMAVNGILWAIMTALIVVGNWHNAMWVLTFFVAVYCLFVAANLSINFTDKHKKKRKFAWRKKDMI